MKYEEITLFSGSAKVAGETTDKIDLTHYLGYSMQIAADDTTPAAGTFTANVTDICTKNSHGFTTGLLVRVSSTVTLPAGLSAGTDYYVIVGGVNTFSLSDSYAHAIAGTDIINIGDAGTGVHTITPTPIAGCSVKLECSNNGTKWDDVASGSVSITADVIKTLNFSGIYYKYVRAVFAITAGQVVLSGSLFTKGE
jgi:hypothetical protein